MRILDEAEALLARMTRGEKAQFLQRVVQAIGDAYPGIDMIDDVCGGASRLLFAAGFLSGRWNRRDGLARVRPICCVPIRHYVPKILGTGGWLQACQLPSLTCVRSEAS